MFWPMMPAVRARCRERVPPADPEQSGESLIVGQVDVSPASRHPCVGFNFNQWIDRDFVDSEPSLCRIGRVAYPNKFAPAGMALRAEAYASTAAANVTHVVLHGVNQARRE